ncbi:hypothetical protein KVV02_007815 [Mortierella alpina]|uniref:PH domain-containing protein n=1 Tax=Mortierella alpina TaxID=64518 RepID=A0A9P8A632_MORAP|nr:hypothetical protein KVV02_007815 [Mortierella alpina]
MLPRWNEPSTQFGGRYILYRATDGPIAQSDKRKPGSDFGFFVFLLSAGCLVSRYKRRSSISSMQNDAFKRFSRDLHDVLSIPGNFLNKKAKKNIFSGEKTKQVKISEAQGGSKADKALISATTGDSLSDCSISEVSKSASTAEDGSRQLLTVSTAAGEPRRHSIGTFSRKGSDRGGINSKSPHSPATGRVHPREEPPIIHCPLSVSSLEQFSTQRRMWIQNCVYHNTVPQLNNVLKSEQAWDTVDESHLHRNGRQHPNSIGLKSTHPNEATGLLLVKRKCEFSPFADADITTTIIVLQVTNRATTKIFDVEWSLRVANVERTSYPARSFKDNPGNTATMNEVFLFDVNEPFQLEMTVTGSPVATKFGTMAGLQNPQTVTLGHLDLSFCLEPQEKTIRTYKLRRPMPEDTGKSGVKSDCDVVIMLGLHILEEPIEDRSWETEVLYQGFLTFMTRGGRASSWKRYWAVLEGCAIKLYDAEYQLTRDVIAAFPLAHIVRVQPPDYEKVDVGANGLSLVVQPQGVDVRSQCNNSGNIVDVSELDFSIYAFTDSTHLHEVWNAHLEEALDQHHANMARRHEVQQAKLARRASQSLSNHSFESSVPPTPLEVDDVGLRTELIDIKDWIQSEHPALPITVSLDQPAMNDSFTRTPKVVLDHFKVNPDRGLTAAQVQEGLKEHGKNELPEEDPTPLWEMILEQFKDQLVIILLVAAAVSFVLAMLEEDDSGTAFVEPIVILLILIANAAVGVIQESNAEKAIEALKEYSPHEAKVLRNGSMTKVIATDIVPGDIIEVAVGDKIPADCRVLEIHSSNFRIDQALLTGESVSVNKVTDVVSDHRAVKQDQINMLFSGTTVVLGKAKAIVVQTGSDTAIGDIHKSITSQISEKTPLKRKLDEFGDDLAKVISVICILVWLVNIRHFNDPSHQGWLKGAIYYFKIAVALAVAAIPEGLSVVITTCLALGTKKMAKKNAIVRSLPSVETLGCTSVICSDKTGTLTTNQMSVARVLVVDNTAGKVAEYQVQGSSFSPIGDILNADGKAISSLSTVSQTLNELAQICAICNNSSISYNPDTDSYINVGEPTEAALKVLVEKMGTDDIGTNDTLDSLSPENRVDACNQYYAERVKKLATLDFSRDRKSMSVLVAKTATDRKTRSGAVSASSASLLVKGAPESILERCTAVRLSAAGEVVPLTAALRATILEKVLDYGEGQALRCLGLAVVENQSPNMSDWDFKNPETFYKYEQNMTFVGLVAMLDPPRPEVAAAIAKCKTAGIRVIVITGDNKNTAESICRKIGVFSQHEDLKHKSYTGPLIPVQLLWVNLVTDGLPATALGFNPPDNEIMRQPPRNSREPLVGGWLFFRYMVVGVYVGCATVFGYAWWFMFYSQGPQISFYQLSHFHQCSSLFPEIGCQMFTDFMSKKATTMSLSILVTIEMFNAINSLSENESLLTMPIWNNMYLVFSIILSMALHFMILYVPFFSNLFMILPLNVEEWKAVVYISLPVIFIDEILKFISRTYIAPPAKKLKQE